MAKTSKAEAEALITRGLDEFGLKPTTSRLEAFMAYLAELKRWSKTYSLTSLKTDEDIITKHFMDSLLYLKALPSGTKSIADVGSGAGFPGLPMKIARPGLDMLLIEPSRKKAAFLRAVIYALGLEGVQVLEKQIEAIEDITVDVAVTRALYSVRDFIIKAAPLVDGGALILSKGPKLQKELDGMNRKHRVLTLPLPLTDIKRQMVIIENVQRRKDAFG